MRSKREAMIQELIQRSRLYCKRCPEKGDYECCVKCLWYIQVQERLRKYQDNGVGGDIDGEESRTY